MLVLQGVSEKGFLGDLVGCQAWPPRGPALMAVGVGCVSGPHSWDLLVWSSLSG